MMSCRTEIHHRMPRHLLVAHDRMTSHSALDGEGIELALHFLELAMRYGVPNSESVSREELERTVDDSCVELASEDHRKLHIADWREWGSRGGKATLLRYGRAWFVHLAHRRWDRISRDELARIKVALLHDTEAST